MRRAAAAGVLLLAVCGGGPHLGTGAGETGLATWYGPGFAGRPTASGEPFDPAGLTAAHRTLPLGSVALVTALATGRAVAVRINDRGPWHGPALIDLSQGAARLLGTDRSAAPRVAVRPAPPGTRPGLVSGGMTSRPRDAAASRRYQPFIP